MLPKLFFIGVVCAHGLFAGYGYRRTLTIDHTKIGATDNTNFPVLVSLTDTSFKTVGNGGKVTSGSGFDVVLFSDSTLVTKLDFEVETYSATTGAIVMWVRVPTLSHTVDTVIYMGYGNAAIVASQENKTRVWDTNFVAVYHVPDGTTLTANDSTSHALNGVIAGPLAAGGKISGGAQFNGTTDKITATGGDFSGPVTLDLWVNPFEFNYGNLIENSALGTYSRDYAMVISNSGSSLFVGFGGGLNLLFLSSPIALNTWNHIVSTADGTTWKVYLNGAIVYSAANTGLPTSVGGVIYLGVEGGGIDQLRGVIDEVRISDSARSADWILSEYNNVNAPATFAVLGPEIVLGASPANARTNTNKVFIL